MNLYNFLAYFCIPVGVVAFIMFFFSDEITDFFFEIIHPQPGKKIFAQYMRICHVIRKIKTEKHLVAAETMIDEFEKINPNHEGIYYTRQLRNAHQTVKSRFNIPVAQTTDIFSQKSRSPMVRKS